MSRQRKKCLNRPKYKKWPLFHRLLMRGTAIYTKLNYNVKYNKEELKAIRAEKGPLFVISTHNSPMDFAISNYPVLGRKVSMVVTVYLFFDPRYGFLIRGMGNCIPKKQFVTDVECVRLIKRMIDKGFTVLIFPEGLFSVGGKTNDLSDALFKLVKWLQVPTFVIRNDGAYCTRARYYFGFKKNKIVSNITYAVTKEDCKNLTYQEIKEKIMPVFEYNDPEYQQKNGLEYVGKKLGNTSGMELVIFVCQKCKSEYTIKTEGHSIYCTECGYSLTLDNFAKFHGTEAEPAIYDRIDKWYDFQEEYIKDIVFADPNFKISEPCTRCTFHEYTAELLKHEEGVMTLDRNGFYYESNNKEKIIKAPIPNPPHVAMEPRERIDLFDKEVLTRFVFKTNFKPVKYLLLARAFHKLNCKDV